MAVKSPHSMYFAAIVCPPKIDDKIRQCKIWMLDRYGCRVAMRAPSHITLIQPFWLDDTREEFLRQMLSSFQFDHGELDIRLSNFSHFSKRVIFIRVLLSNGLLLVKSAIENHFRQSLGDLIKTDERPFTPHVSIATRDMKRGDFYGAWDHFGNMPFDESFNTSVISLLKLSPEKWNVIAENNWSVQIS